MESAGLYANAKGVPVRRGEADRHTQREESHVEMEAEVGAMRLQTEEHPGLLPGHQKLEKGLGWLLPQNPQKNQQC